LRASKLFVNLQEAHMTLLKPRGKKITNRAALLFFTIMLLLTFSSRTINYYLTPKVEIVGVKDGYINSNQVFNNVKIFHENTISVEIPFKLIDGIRINKIHVQVNSAVKQGDILITFNLSDCQDLSKQLERQLKHQKTALLEFEKNMSDKIAELDNSISECNYEIDEIQASLQDLCVNEPQLSPLISEIEEIKQLYEKKLKTHSINKLLFENKAISTIEITLSEEETKDLNKKLLEKKEYYNRLQKQLIDDKNRTYKNIVFTKNKYIKELNYIKTNSIINGKSLELIEDEYKETCFHADFIRKIIDSSGNITSPASGIVANVMLDHIEKYSGQSEILSIAVNGTSLKLITKVSPGQMENLKTNTPCTIMFGDITAEASIEYIFSTKEENYAVINSSGIPIEKIPVFTDIIVIVESNSNYFDHIVPNSVFISSHDELYILKNRQSFWGNEYYVEKRKVITGESSAFETQVIDGITSSDMLVCGWDRELRDGCRVMLPLE